MFVVNNIRWGVRERQKSLADEEEQWAKQKEKKLRRKTYVIKLKEEKEKIWNMENT